VKERPTPGILPAAVYAISTDILRQIPEGAPFVSRDGYSRAFSFPTCKIKVFRETIVRNITFLDGGTALESKDIREGCFRKPHQKP
jgi:hypothetical protein